MGKAAGRRGKGEFPKPGPAAWPLRGCDLPVKAVWENEDVVQCLLGFFGEEDGVVGGLGGDGGEGDDGGGDGLVVAGESPGGFDEGVAAAAHDFEMAVDDGAGEVGDGVLGGDFKGTVAEGEKGFGGAVGFAFGEDDDGGVMLDFAE